MVLDQASGQQLAGHHLKSVRVSQRWRNDDPRLNSGETLDTIIEEQQRQEEWGQEQEHSSQVNA